MSKSEEEISKLAIITELVNKYGDDLIEEITYIVMENGQGDCYGCLCSDYCIGNSCFNAIKEAVKEILKAAEVKQ